MQRKAFHLLLLECIYLGLLWGMARFLGLFQQSYESMCHVPMPHYLNQDIVLPEIQMLGIDMLVQFLMLKFLRVLSFFFSFSVPKIGRAHV